MPTTFAPPPPIPGNDPGYSILQPPACRVHRALFPGPSSSLSGALFLSWKRIQRQQGLQESSSGQSFFVRNVKVGWEKDEMQGRASSQERNKEENQLCVK